MMTERAVPGGLEYTAKRVNIGMSISTAQSFHARNAFSQMLDALIIPGHCNLDPSVVNAETWLDFRGHPLCFLADEAFGIFRSTQEQSDSWVEIGFELEKRKVRKSQRTANVNAKRL